MGVYEIFEQENADAFHSTIKEYYILAGKGGGVFLSKSKKYYIVTKTVMAVYDIEKEEISNKSIVMRWPILIQTYKKQNKTRNYFKRFEDGQIYRITGAFYDQAPFLYVKSAQKVYKTKTEIDISRMKYRQPTEIKDDILGTLILDKAMGEFEGMVPFQNSSIEVYALVEWDNKSSWEKPLEIARSFVQNIEENDKNARKYISEDFFNQEDFVSDIEYYSEEIGIDPIHTSEQFYNFLNGKLKYIFVEQDGAYTIAYNDGDLFGGHEIDVYVDSQGEYYDVDIVG